MHAEMIEIIELVKKEFAKVVFTSFLNFFDSLSLAFLKILSITKKQIIEIIIYRIKSISIPIMWLKSDFIFKKIFIELIKTMSISKVKK